ncbi:hypothetical protein TNCV_4141681 [Trichonephila clavipes]|nr:hypothetical protein TNCV_4141681 [Trichonephila clavipes]
MNTSLTAPRKSIMPGSSVLLPLYWQRSIERNTYIHHYPSLYRDESLPFSLKMKICLEPLCGPKHDSLLKLHRANLLKNGTLGSKIVRLSCGKTSNSLVRLVEREERCEASNHSQGVLPLKWSGTEIVLTPVWCSKVQRSRQTYY